MDPQENLLASIYPQGFLTKRQLATPGEAVSFFPARKMSSREASLMAWPTQIFHTTRHKSSTFHCVCMVSLWKFLRWFLFDSCPNALFELQELVGAHCSFAGHLLETMVINCSSAHHKAQPSKNNPFLFEQILHTNLNGQYQFATHPCRWSTHPMIPKSHSF